MCCVLANGAFSVAPGPFSFVLRVFDFWPQLLKSKVQSKWGLTSKFAYFIVMLRTYIFTLQDYHQFYLRQSFPSFLRHLHQAMSACSFFQWAAKHDFVAVFGNSECHCKCFYTVQKAKNTTIPDVSMCSKLKAEVQASPPNFTFRYEGRLSVNLKSLVSPLHLFHYSRFMYELWMDECGNRS